MQQATEAMIVCSKSSIMRWQTSFLGHMWIVVLSGTMCFSGFDACEFFMTLGMQALYILAHREQDNFGHTGKEEYWQC